MTDNTPNTPIDQAGGLEEFFASIRARLESIVTNSSTINGTVDAADYTPGNASGVTLNFGDPLIIVDEAGRDSTIEGNENTNIIIARDGNDTLVGFGSLDILLGGAGVDTTNYAYVNVTAGEKGVFVDLGNGLSVTSGGDVDILSSIENVIGTRGDDVLLGSNVSNIFLGNGGNDIIDGRGNGDTDVVQLYGNAEDYTYSGRNIEDGSIVITHKETGNTTTLFNIELVQFKEGSDGGDVKIFNIETGAAIAYDQTVDTIEGNPGEASAVKTFVLDTQTIGDAVGDLITGAAFEDGEFEGAEGGFITVHGVYGTLTIDISNGSATYEQNEAADALNIDDGQVSDTFTYEVAGGDTATVTITIDPVNDAPVLEFKSPADGILGIVEDELTTGSYKVHTAEAFLKVTDVDTEVTGDNFASSATLTDWDFSHFGDPGDDKIDIPGEILTWISQNETPGTNIDSNEGTLVFTYSVADGELDLLAQGQKLTLTYEVKISDTTGYPTDAATKTVTVIIEGSNDAPVITAADVSHTIYEGVEHSDDAPVIEATGSITVTDPDNREKLEVTIETADFDYKLADGTPADLPVDPSVIADLLLADNFSFDGTDDTGSTQSRVKFSFAEDANLPLTFNYSYGAADDIDFLADGEKLVLTFPVTVTDRHGEEAKTEVILTIVGTNDGPTIEAGQAGLSATITEESDVPAIPGQLLKANGEFEFVDVDVSDINTAEISGKSFEFHGDNDRVWGSESNRDDIIEALQNSFRLTGLNEGGSDGVGTVSWSFSAFEGLVDFLAEGEWIDLNFVVKVTDASGEAAEETVSIRIEGKNDAPVVILHDKPGTITEFTNETGADGWFDYHTVSGTMVVYDADNTVKGSGDGAFGVEIGDVTWAYVPGDQIDDPAPGHLFQSLTNTELLWFDELDEVGRLKYHYSVKDSDLDFLREGEVVEITYPVTITDPDNGSVQENIVIKIVGTNDRPVISSVVADPAAFAETDDAADGFNDADQHISTEGTITVADADYGDTLGASVHSSAVAWSHGDVPADVLNALTNAGNFTFTPVSRENNPDHFDGNGAIELDFLYNADVDLDFLGAGEVLTLTFQVVVQDDSGAGNDTSAPVTLTMTITGTNDKPVITVDAGNGDSVEGTITEPADDAGGTELKATGTFQVSDEDTNDDLSISKQTAGVPMNTGALTTAQVAALTAALATSDVFAAELNNGTVSWTFALDSGLLNFLGEGDAVDVLYTVEISDGNGGVVEQQIVIHLEGGNDPVVVVGAEAAESTETAEEQDIPQHLQTSGTVTVKDLDVSDQLTLTVASNATAVLKDGDGNEYQNLDADVLELISKLVDPNFISADAIDSNGGEAAIEFLYDTGAGVDVDFLAAGDELVLTYQAQIGDGTSSVLQDITVKITGTNDRPTVESTSADGLGTSFNILTEMNAQDADHSDVLSLNDISGQLDISLDALLGSEGVDLSLSLELLKDAGVITVSDNGDVSFSDDFTSVLQQVLGPDGSVNLSGSLKVTDDSGTGNAVSTSADFDLTIDVDGAGVPAPEAVTYGTGEDAPDFLIAGFDPVEEVNTNG